MVTYTKEQRQQARDKKSGVFTIDIDRRACNGPRITLQGLSSEKQLSRLLDVLHGLIGKE